MEPSTPHRRLRAFAGLSALGFGVLAVKLVFVQVIHPAPPLGPEASENRIARPARRGSVLSADEKILAWSELRVHVLADPTLIGTNLVRLRPIAEAMAQVLGTPTNGITVEALLPLLTPRTETRRWSRLETNRFEPLLDRQQRPRFDAAGRPLLRPVLITNWFANTNFTNRAVVVVSNVPIQDWRRLESNLHNLKFPELLAVGNQVTNLLRSRPSLLNRLKARLGQEAGPVKAWEAEWKVCRQNQKELIQQLRELKATAISTQPVEIRSYPHGALASHVLGYVTNDDRAPRVGTPFPLSGATGIEHMLDPELTGSPGELVTHTGKGRELVHLRERDVAAKDGLSVQLTLDTRIQNAVENALDEAVLRLQPKAITAIVVRPATGEILALANRPTYDPNNLRHAEVEARWNRAITAPTEPGSTFKLCTYAAALDLGKLSLDEPIDCEGGVWNPGAGKPVRDAEGHHLGSVPARMAFAKSSNVGAAKIGLRMSTNEFLAYMKQLGFLNRSGLFYRQVETTPGRFRDDWGGENAGGIPAWIRDQRIGTELQGRLSYGYGLYVTPLQTVFAMAAIANDGVLMKPLLIRELRSPEGAVVKRFEPTVSHRAVSSATAAAMRDALRLVVTDGTGKLARLQDFDVAGKTGTAHKQFNGQQSADKYISTFVGFLPAERPELCILVLTDEPIKRGPSSHFGGTACGPVFTNIASQAAAILALKASPPPPPATPVTPPGPSDLSTNILVPAPTTATVIPGNPRPPVGVASFGNPPRSR